jgi:hypothetical protein
MREIFAHKIANGTLIEVFGRGRQVGRFADVQNAGVIRDFTERIDDRRVFLQIILVEKMGVDEVHTHQEKAHCQQTKGDMLNDPFQNWK